jgi:hypothetical protein
MSQPPSAGTENMEEDKEAARAASQPYPSIPILVEETHPQVSVGLWG